MSRQRALQPTVESMEKMTLLSAGVVAHPAAHVAAIAHEAVTGDVHLRGAIVSGRGYVSPLGSVKGQYTLVDDSLTLSNKYGTVDLQLSQLHERSHLVQFRAWQIVGGTGDYASAQGQGSGVFTLVIVGKRAVNSSAVFY